MTEYGMCAEYRCLLMKLITEVYQNTITPETLDDYAHPLGCQSAEHVAYIIERERNAETDEGLPF